jgi:hypothetical protein
MENMKFSRRLLEKTGSGAFDRQNFDRQNFDRQNFDRHEF